MTFRSKEDLEELHRLIDYLFNLKETLKGAEDDFAFEQTFSNIKEYSVSEEDLTKIKMEILETGQKIKVYSNKLLN